MFRFAFTMLLLAVLPAIPAWAAGELAGEPVEARNTPSRSLGPGFDRHDRPDTPIDDFAPFAGRAKYMPKDYKPIRQRVQFVVFGDRTGREQPWFTAPAFDLVNALRPEFVLSVGDQIDGYVEEQGKFPPEEIARRNREMWGIYDAFVARLTVPFFYVVGNHDMWNKASAAIYDEVHGPPYYSFDYKGIHVIALNSEEQKRTPGPGAGLLGQAQFDWLKADLERSQDATLTVIAIHNPLWLASGGRAWAAMVEPLLAGRNCIVFGGHLHTYSYEVRNGIRYVVVGPTSAGQGDHPNDSTGILRHVTLVTVDDGTPHLSLVKLGGAIAGETIPNGWRDRIQPIRSASRLQYEPAEPRPGEPVTITWSLHNPTKEPVTIRPDWPGESSWRIESKAQPVTLEPGECRRVEFTARQPLGGAGDLPTMEATFTWPDSDVPAAPFTWPAEPLRRVEAASIAGIQVDGKVDEQWAAATPVTFTSVRQLESCRDKWQGRDDMSARLRVAIDGTTLYLLAEVTDDTLVADQDEIAVAVGPAWQAGNQSASRSAAYFWINIGQRNGPAKINWGSKRRLEVRAASGARSDGYAMEVAIDISRFLESLEGQAAFAFNFAIGDSDAGESWETMTVGVWCGTKGALSSARDAGVLLISEPARKAAIEAAATQQAAVSSASE
jgi:hypothetical protein